MAALGSLSPLLCYCVMLFLKFPPCFFTLPCLSKDFTQEFSDASWTYGYFLTSGLSNEIPSLSCRAGLLRANRPSLAAHCSSRAAVSCFSGHVVEGSFLQKEGDWGPGSLGNTASPRASDKVDSGTFILITPLLYCQAVLGRGFSWWLFAFSGRWEEYLFSSSLAHTNYFHEKAEIN